MDFFTQLSIIVIILAFLCFLIFHVGRWILNGIAWILLKTVYRPVLRKLEAERNESIAWLKSLGIEVRSDNNPNPPTNYTSIR